MNDTQYQEAKADAYRAAFGELAALVTFHLTHESLNEKARKIEADLAKKLEALRNT